MGELALSSLYPALASTGAYQVSAPSISPGMANAALLWFVCSQKCSSRKGLSYSEKHREASLNCTPPIQICPLSVFASYLLASSSSPIFPKGRKVSVCLERGEGVTLLCTVHCPPLFPSSVCSTLVPLAPY